MAMCGWSNRKEEGGQLALRNGRRRGSQDVVDLHKDVGIKGCIGELAGQQGPGLPIGHLHAPSSMNPTGVAMLWR